MKSAIITKAKATTRPISTSFKVLSADILDQVVAIERNSSKNPWPTEHFRSSLENSTNLSYALMRKDKLIGYVIAALAIDSADILNIAVDSGYQRQGYATKLLNRLVSEFSEKGAKEVFLETRVSNNGAISFYNSQGFKQISVRKNYYMKNSNDSTEREDGIIMRLEIATAENNNAL
jgi:ribosomal-protein-alanine N-acetyltransferase